MICPICNHSGARRSRRHSLSDYLVGLVGVYPWRCRDCHARFHSRLMSLSDSLHAHCPFCGNHQLRRISKDFVQGGLAPVWRLLGIPSFRCVPCRHNYFSLLPMRQEDDERFTLASGD